MWKGRKLNQHAYSPLQPFRWPPLVIDASSNHRLLSTSEEPYTTTLSSASKSITKHTKQSAAKPTLSFSNSQRSWTSLHTNPFLPMHFMETLPHTPHPSSTQLMFPKYVASHTYFPPPYHVFHTMKKHCFLATRPLCSLASCVFTCEAQRLLRQPFLSQEQTPVSISGQFTWSCLWIPALQVQRAAHTVMTNFRN